ncbi:MAG: serine/threonine-protein kinase [Vicinamibacteria bacterium]
MNLDRIGKYRIVERIGQGAMGEVFKAHDPLLNRFVAIKTISPTLASDPEFRQRFQREAQSAAQLNHPNIVTIYDFGNDEAGLTYMAMELVEGLDLRESIRRRALGPLLRRLDLMVQLCDGLGFAHARGVVHRDLKPANIHVQPSGQVKILDFGLARLASSEMTKTGTVMGTPHYMSPEQVRGQKADARSDVFSLGAVCYEMVAGTRPFDGRTVPEVLQAIVERDATPLRAKAPDTPQSVSAVIERALSRDPAARFADAAEMGRALAAAQKSLAGETIVGAAPGAEATVLQHPGDTMIGHATEGSTALDPRRRSSILRRSLSVTSRQDPTVAAELTHVQAAPSRLPLVAGAAVAVLVAAGIGGYMYVRSRAVATAPAASTAQEQSVLTEALLSGKVELARADLDNHAYDDAAAHAREALAIDPASAEAKEVLDKAVGLKAEVEKAVADAKTAVARGDTSTASEALGRLLALDRRHPAARELTRDLNRYSRRQAEEARGGERRRRGPRPRTRAPSDARLRPGEEADRRGRRPLRAGALRRGGRQVHRVARRFRRPEARGRRGAVRRSGPGGSGAGGGLAGRGGPGGRGPARADRDPHADRGALGHRHADRRADEPPDRDAAAGDAAARGGRGRRPGGARPRSAGSRRAPRDRRPRPRVRDAGRLAVPHRDGRALRRRREEAAGVVQGREVRPRGDRDRVGRGERRGSDRPRPAAGHDQRPDAAAEAARLPPRPRRRVVADRVDGPRQGLRRGARRGPGETGGGEAPPPGRERSSRAPRGPSRPSSRRG